MLAYRFHTKPQQNASFSVLTYFCSIWKMAAYCLSLLSLVGSCEPDSGHTE
nr:MAG TPA: hypothetical protein [Caudoviricetes sp.]